MHRQGKTSEPFEFALLLLLGVLWGIPYALTKISLTTIPPITIVAARVSIAAIVLWLIVFSLRSKLPTRWDLFPRLFVQGWIGCILPYTLIAFGQRSVDSALAAILNSTTPLFVCLISLLWTRHETLSFGRLFGVSVGLAGVVMIAGGGALPGSGQSAFGQAAIILATIASAFSVIHGRRFADIAPEVAAAGTLTSAAVVSTVAGKASSAGSANGVGSAAQFDNPRSVAVDTNRPSASMPKQLSGLICSSMRQSSRV